jgi:hypothetical protein
MMVWTFFGSDECDAGTDGAVTAGGATAGAGAEASEEIGTVFGGSGLSADHRETNSSLEPALTMDVWLELFVRAFP